MIDHHGVIWVYSVWCTMPQADGVGVSCILASGADELGGQAAEKNPMSRDRGVKLDCRC